ncbi:MAG: hypothetical protein HY777_07950 [Betaproteobacteria bacterium]|nr:hypothetical protein [Betaproteobacteria bacterium]
MDVSALSSSVNAASGTQVRARPSEQDQQALQALQAQRAQNAPAADENEAVNRARAEAESARPSVNTSGQTVGKVINVTA